MTSPSFPPFDEEEECINFFSEDVDFELPTPERMIRWIELVAHQEESQINAVNFIFCSDNYLLELNVSYLNHNTLTDIITFPYSTPPSISGDIFISIERVTENAKAFGVAFEQELHRVMVHGILHLCGYRDKTPEEKNLMTAKENEALSLLADLPVS